MKYGFVEELSSMSAFMNSKSQSRKIRVYYNGMVIVNDRDSPTDHLMVIVPSATDGYVQTSYMDDVLRANVKCTHYTDAQDVIRTEVTDVPYDD
jgi:hypothetical protein